MLYLRPLNDPPFETVSDVIDFVSQVLEVCHYITQGIYKPHSTIHELTVARVWRSCTNKGWRTGEQDSFDSA